jgi:sugar phosphate isomerase/epimerase
MSPLQSFDRRLLLKGFAGGLVTTALARGTSGQTRQSNEATATKGGKPTRFQIACMTLPYSQYPLERALSGIKTAGYKYVAWGTTHREPGESKPVPVMSPDAPPEKARELGRRCRDMGLEPVMMFSTIYPEDPKALEVLTNRVRQAEAAGIEHVLTFGHTDPASQKLWVERLKKLGPIARDHGVLIVAKQHGEIGELTGKIIREVDDEGVQVNYDAGNVMDYTKGKTNPLEDIKTCLELVRSFCMKDHRLYPMDQDCAPGFGEIDHYRLLGNVAFTGRAMPLCCENISIPGVRPTSPEDIDNQGRRTREFLEYVIRALHA